MDNNLIGKKVSASVTTVENYGLFLKLDSNEKAFLPKENMNVSKKKKLKEIFSEGFVISAQVKGCKKDYYVLSQKESIEKETVKKENSKSVIKKDSKKKIKKATKPKEKEINIEEKQLEKEETKNEPKVKSLTDLKKLKYIGNMKISVKKVKDNKKVSEIEDEQKPELLKVPENFIENVIKTTDEAITNFKQVKKSLKEQGYVDE